MKLTKVTLHGYKRFEQKSSMNVEGKLIAIVGPNEAGKSSILKALESLNSEAPLTYNSDLQDLTRGTNPPADQPIIEVKFLLEDGDQQLLDSLPILNRPRWFHIQKYTDGKLKAYFDLKLTRDTRSRQRLIRNIKRVANELEVSASLSGTPPKYKLFGWLGGKEITESDWLSIIEQTKEVVSFLSSKSEIKNSHSLRRIVSELKEFINSETVNGQEGIKYSKDAADKILTITWELFRFTALHEHLTSLLSESTELAKRLEAIGQDQLVSSDEIVVTLELIKKIPDLGNFAQFNFIMDLAQSLQEFVDNEEALNQKLSEDPDVVAARILLIHRPQFLFFTEDARSLPIGWDLERGPSDVPASIQNLALLAELNLDDLYSAYKAKAHVQLRTLLGKANRKLERRFEKIWSQSDSAIAVHLEVNDRVLHIYIKDENVEMSSIIERSDGLRQYVALRAFLAGRSNPQLPILLIDEADNHLHYDAQADLIQMLTSQQVAAKVIYTTHSVGCLPEDIGTGVRIVKTVSNNRSIIKDWFWSETRQPGYSPLLFSIGASTLAFITIRHALVTEGATDFILLPTLFREAIEAPVLEFQVVPGLSSADNTAISILENGAPRTAFLTDNDDGGKRLQKKLSDAGIDPSRIFCLPTPETVLEDYIRADLYIDAVNAILQQNGVTHRLRLSKLPTVNRPRLLKQWCRDKGINPEPGKREIAQYLLERRSAEGITILADDCKEALRKLHADILNALKRTGASNT